MSPLSPVVGEDVTHEVEHSQQDDDSPVTFPLSDHGLQTRKHKQQTFLHCRKEAFTNINSFIRKDVNCLKNLIIFIVLDSVEREQDIFDQIDDESFCKSIPMFVLAWVWTFCWLP